MDTKICIKCLQQKPVKSFSLQNNKITFRNICKTCTRKNPIKTGYCHICNTPTTKTKYCELCAVSQRKKQLKLHRRKNRKKYYYKYYSNKTKRIERSLRTRLYKFVKKKQFKMMDIIGCDNQFLLNHLSSQFTQGMSWANYGEWHIDHIVPCCKFNLSDSEEQKKCFNFMNLQPLWAVDNILKAGR